MRFYLATRKGGEAYKFQVHGRPGCFYACYVDFDIGMHAPDPRIGQLWGFTHPSEARREAIERHENASHKNGKNRVFFFELYFMCLKAPKAIRVCQS